MQTILLVDDDTEVLNLNAKYLKNNGYRIVAIPNPVKAVSMVKDIRPDCIILDVMMPEMNGFTACKELRKQIDVPIIFLTGKTTEKDKINGLLLGADDYIEKPYSLKELAVRVMVNIRRYHSNAITATMLSFPPLSVNLADHKAYYNSEEILLSNREFEVLYYLMKHPNEIITFQQIGEKVWGTYQETDRRSIMVNVSRLRKKLECYDGLENIIETVWSQGYKFTYKNA